METTNTPTNPTNRVGGEGVFVYPCGGDTGTWLETGWGFGHGRSVLTDCGCRVAISKNSRHWRRGRLVQYVCGQELAVVFKDEWGDPDIDRLWESDWDTPVPAVTVTIASVITPVTLWCLDCSDRYTDTGGGHQDCPKTI